MTNHIYNQSHLEWQITERTFYYNMGSTICQHRASSSCHVVLTTILIYSQLCYITYLQPFRKQHAKPIRKDVLFDIIVLHKKLPQFKLPLLHHFDQFNSPNFHKNPIVQAKRSKQKLAPFSCYWYQIKITPQPQTRPYQDRRRGRPSRRERPPKMCRVRCRCRDHQVRDRIHNHKGKRIS